MSEYQIASQRNSNTPKRLAEFLQKEGQFLLPMVELVAETETAIDELIDVTGRATVEAVLLMSAQEVAGPKHPGKAGGTIGWAHPSGKVAFVCAWILLFPIGWFVALMVVSFFMPKMPPDF